MLAIYCTYFYINNPRRDKVKSEVNLQKHVNSTQEAM